MGTTVLTVFSLFVPLPVMAHIQSVTRVFPQRPQLLLQNFPGRLTLVKDVSAGLSDLPMVVMSVEPNALAILMAVRAHPG